MGILKKLLSHTQRKPAAQATLITRQLCKKKTASTHDIEALMALGHDAIKPFHQTLSRDHQMPDLNLAKQLIELIASYHKPNQSKLALSFLAGFTEYPEPTLVKQAISHMANYSLQAAPLLQGALQSKLKYTRTYAIKALGSMHDLSALELLIHALQDLDYRVRAEAAEALGEINHHKAIFPLLQILGDQNWLVRESASNALSQFSHNLISKPLTAMLNDAHAQKRIQALHTLGALQQSENNPMIISALDDPNIEVQYEAINALAHTHNHIAIIPLLSHFHTANDVMKNHISQACSSIGINPVAAQLSHDQPVIRMAAAEVISLYGDTQLLPLLCNAWQYERNVETAMRLIIAIGKLAIISEPNTPDSVIKTLIRAANSTSKANAYHAKMALEVLQHPLAEQFIQLPLQQTKVAIHCPNCLEILQLKQPITHKQWACEHCHLSFNMSTDKHGQLIVSPVTHKPTRSPTSTQNRTWFEVLQINHHADTQTIKRAFRGLLKQYHPDKVATLGVEFKLLAEEKTRELTWALRTGLEKQKKN